MLLSLLRKTLAPFGAVLVIVIILLMARARFSFLRAIPMWIWLSIFALIFVVWMGVVFFKWMAEKRRAKAIEDGILDQAQQGADQASPARRAEIEELKRSLAEALIMLKKGPQGNKALYSLPWYLIIGPPAIGKTTAIVNSGLNFPNMTTAKRMRGAGGTRNCDWWFSTDAILLDTAGRYAESIDRSETETEWFGFLDLLKTHRKKGPINGLILGYSIEDLLNRNETTLIDSARELRQRMDEILDRLGWTFPVYLLFTKCDLISGFTDYFSSLSPTERQQVWGALYELEPEGDQSAAKRFSGEFDLLLSNLRNSRTHRMSGISRSENWGRVFMFPEEFANLKDKMTLFIETLFEANPYRRDVPLFRGTYFSSGKQLGKPFDLVVRKIQSMLGAITDALEIGEQDEKDDAYFVRDLFAKVLKSDQHMVGLTGESHRRKKKLALYMSGGFLALSLLACTWIGVSYFKLRIKMDRTRSAAVELQSQQSAGTMVEELEQLEKLRREITGSWRAFPLTAANKVQETAQGIYLEAVTRRILGPLEHRISRELDNADALNGGEVRQALRTEMMLLFPERKDEIGWGAEELALGLSTFGMEGIGESQKARDQLDDMAREFLDLGQPIENVDRRHELRRGGRRLAQTHTPREFFRGIVFEASLTCQDLTLDLLAPDQMILQSEVSIPAAFTKAGWERSVQPQVRDVDKTVAMDNKLIVMAGAEPTEHPPARETLLEIYRDAFPEAWVDFFESVRLRSYTDCDHLQDDLRKLHRPGTSPLLRIVREAAEISNLKTQIPIGDLPGMSNVDGIYRTMQPVRFLGQPTDDAPAHLEGYADQLSQVYRQVESCANDDDFQLDESVLREANHWLDDFMDDTGGNQIASALRTLLKRPIDLAAHVMGQTSLASAEARLQNEWSDQVFDFFHDKLNDTYPFSNTNRNADPKDVAEFFGPGGAMEEFEKLVTSGAAASFPGRRCKRAIDDAKQIRRDLMMTDKSFQTQFALEVQAVRSTNSEKGINNQRRIDRVKLTINGVELIDRIGAHTRKDFTWSTDDAELNAVLILESVRTHEVVASREFDGTVWSICQLFENAKTLGSRAGGWAVTWEFPDEEVEVEFYLTTREQIDPFFIRESPFRQFALPQGVHQ